jgi:beta-lactam-binding protein with PASTA domain
MSGIRNPAGSRTRPSTTHEVRSAPLPFSGVGLLLIAFVVLALQGCGFATLDHLLVKSNGNWVQTDGVISVTDAKGKQSDAAPGTILQKGDIIETGPDTSASISFLTSGEVILRPSTRIAILNPSLFAYFGELFVKVKGQFDIHYAYGTAGAKGTEYVVKVEPNDEVTVTVLEGRVELTSKTAAWPPIELGPREQARLSQAAAPRPQRLDQDEFNRAIEWINDIVATTDPESARIIVPDINGMTRLDAVATLERESLRLGNLQRLLTGKAEVGSILRQRPAANTRATVNSSVDVDIEAKPTKVPDIQGLTQSEATRRLTERQLHLGRIEQVLGEGRVGTVSYQSPSPNTVVMTDTPVDVGILAESAVVPNLQGMSLARAQQMLSSNKLSSGNVEYRITGGAAVDQVLSQQPPSGQRVFAYSQVSLVVEAESVLTPNLVGQNRYQAEQQLQSQRLVLGSVQERRVANTEAGTVLDQSPYANTRVPPGSRVDITVAAEVVEVPNLVGSQYQSAVQALQSARLRTGHVSNRLDDRNQAGTVLDQQPRAGTQVDPNSPVNLTIAEAGVRVPAVSGRSFTLQSAAKSLSQVGLRYSSSNQRTDQYPNGTVISQSPSAGALVRQGEQVRLTIAEEIPKCTVPDVTNYSRSRASAALSKAGFRVNFTGSNASDGMVERQFPAAYERTLCESTVTLQMKGGIEQNTGGGSQSYPQIKQQPEVYQPPIISPEILERLRKWDPIK